MGFSTIKFLQDYTPQAAHARSFTAGEVVELSEASAQHFLCRGLAVYAKGNVGPAEAPEENALSGEVPTLYGRLKGKKPAGEKKKQSSASRQDRASQKTTVTESDDTEKKEEK